MQTFFDSDPGSWQELEAQVHQAFEEMGYEATRDCELETVRGRVRVDVYAIKKTTPIPTVVVCECKHWKRAVNQNTVYALRSVCSDIGSNFGLLISKVGFQSGAQETRNSTNIHLLNFSEFQVTFFSEWKNGIFMRLVAITDELQPLVNRKYVDKNENLAKLLEGVNVFRKYDVFFGEQRFTNFFIADKTFPIDIIDPRGDPRILKSISIRSHREYFDLCVAGATDAKIFFAI